MQKACYEKERNKGAKNPRILRVGAIRTQEGRGNVERAGMLRCNSPKHTKGKTGYTTCTGKATSHLELSVPTSTVKQELSFPTCHILDSQEQKPQTSKTTRNSHVT